MASELPPDSTGLRTYVFEAGVSLPQVQPSEVLIDGGNPTTSSTSSKRFLDGGSP